MKRFEKDGKINFVDENNVFVGYDMEQSCYERANSTKVSTRSASGGVYRRHAYCDGL